MACWLERGQTFGAPVGGQSRLHPGGASVDILLGQRVYSIPPRFFIVGRLLLDKPAKSLLISLRQLLAQEGQYPPSIVPRLQAGVTRLHTTRTKKTYGESICRAGHRLCPIDGGMTLLENHHLQHRFRTNRSVYRRFRDRSSVAKTRPGGALGSRRVFLFIQIQSSPRL